MEKIDIKNAKFTALEVDGDNKQLRCITPDGTVQRVDIANMTPEEAYTAYIEGENKEVVTKNPVHIIKPGDKVGTKNANEKTV